MSDRLAGIFDRDRPVIGMVHLEALPGSPGWAGSMEPVLERARADAGALARGGVDGLIVENYGDTPFYVERVPAETVAAVTRAVEAVRSETDLPLGVNVLRNDARAALGIAAATGAEFIRVNVHTGSMFTDQGLVQGRAAETIRLRKRLCPAVAVLADIFVKHATPPPGARLLDSARDAVERGHADGLICSGTGTGRPADPDQLRALKTTVSEVPVWLGSGLTVENVADFATIADGFIVGSAFQTGGVAGAAVEEDRVKRLITALRDAG